MSTIKAKNIKQTVIGGTTQPLKLGGILEDGSDAKISIGSDGTTSLKGTAQSLETIVDYTVSVAAQNFTFNTLTLPSSNMYRMYIWGAALGATDIYFYINGNTTSTNYYSQFITADGTSNIANRVNSSVCAFITTSGSVTQIDFGIDSSNYLKLNSYTAAAAPVLYRSHSIGSQFSTGGNITSISLVSSIYNLTVGTRIKLVRIA